MIGKEVAEQNHRIQRRKEMDLARKATRAGRRWVALLEMSRRTETRKGGVVVEEQGRGEEKGGKKGCLAFLSSLKGGKSILLFKTLKTTQF